jgi:Protein of unknown function (DUF416)
MTSCDAIIEPLANRLRSLPGRAQIALFWASSMALLPEAEAWAEHTGMQTVTTLSDTLDEVYRIVVSGELPENIAELLETLEATTPHGESPDAFDSTYAQDCWICADVSIRLLVKPEYDAAPAIYYALEPIFDRVTNELYHVSQVGSSDQEASQVEVILNHPRVAESIDFCMWACEFLGKHETLDVADLAIIKERARVLAPRGEAPGGSGKGSSI